MSDSENATPEVIDAGLDAPDEAHADIDDLSYEEARDELVAIVAKLEAGSASLEESMDLWGRGEKLAAHCQRWLDSAEKKLDDAEDEPEA